VRIVCEWTVGVRACVWGGGRLYYMNCALVGYCRETSVRNYHHPEERSYLLRGGNLQSREVHFSFLGVTPSW
jgi:hypothetical protein